MWLFQNISYKIRKIPISSFATRNIINLIQEESIMQRLKQLYVIEHQQTPPKDPRPGEYYINESDVTQIVNTSASSDQIAQAEIQYVAQALLSPDVDRVYVSSSNKKLNWFVNQLINSAGISSGIILESKSFVVTATRNHLRYQLIVND